jgi:alcohol dehydrogenase class IV
MLFTIDPKSRIVFGEHASDQVGEQTRTLGCSKILCVYDKGVKDAGIADAVIENLEAAGLEIIRYDGVLADPPDRMVDECGDLARKEKVDGIVGVGGGSALDTAKAVNVLLANPGVISDYYFRPGAKPHMPGKPLVLVPTTAGTASEITHVSVITNTVTGAKGGIKGPATIATVAIVDPLLTVSVPPGITAATGMDTFAHALEAYTSGINNNIMSDMLAEKSMSLVVQNLPVAVQNGSDIGARTNMCFACLLAGMAFSDAPCHFGHAFGHALGAVHHVSHGIGCAIALPGVVQIVSDVMSEKIRRVGELAGLKLGDNDSPKELGTAVSRWLIGFNKSIGIPTMKELKIAPSDLNRLAEDVTKDVCFNFLPVKLTDDNVLALLQSTYDV